jgi:hypothetical protein
MKEGRSTSSDGIDELKQTAAQDGVCYEVWPEYEISHGEKVMIGFSLELYGAESHDSSKLMPGCRRCIETYCVLRRIAEWILPKDERSSRYELSPFDGSLHAAKTRSFRPEVELSIKILHRHDYFRPVDDCRERCMKEMEEKLRQLGIRRER